MSFKEVIRNRNNANIEIRREERKAISEHSETILEAIRGRSWIDDGLSSLYTLEATRNAAAMLYLIDGVIRELSEVRLQVAQVATGEGYAISPPTPSLSDVLRELGRLMALLNVRQELLAREAAEKREAAK